MYNQTRGQRPTRTERLLTVLSDQEWHSTRELVRRVGHTFGGAKFKLVGYGYVIERAKHPKKYQHQYRLADEPPTGSKK